MKIFLIILVVIAVVIIAYFLINILKDRSDFRRDHPYVLSGQNTTDIREGFR